MNKETLNFVQQLVSMQMQSTPGVSVANVTRELLGILKANEFTNSEVLAAKFSNVIEKTPVACWDAKETQCPPDMVAPSPTVELSGDVYDSLEASGTLPRFEKLPESFGGTDYSCIRLNDFTLAMSCEHYYDLLALRDECKQLRSNVAHLEATLIEASRRHLAIEELAKAHAMIERYPDGKFMVIAGSLSHFGVSLTDCMENVVSQLRARVPVVSVIGESPEPVTPSMSQTEPQPVPQSIIDEDGSNPF